MNNLIGNMSNHHFICGLTRSGKSYFAQKALLQKPAGVLYMNIQGEDLDPRFMTVRTDEIQFIQLLEALHEGVKIDLQFANQKMAYEGTAGYILEKLTQSGGFDEYRPVYVAVDECHLLTGPSREAARMVSTAGLKKGIRCVWITQRPALCDKTIYTQALEHYIFYIPPADKEYMRTKGLDYDKCLELWGPAGSHQYVYYNGRDLIGRPAIK